MRAEVSPVSGRRSRFRNSDISASSSVLRIPGMLGHTPCIHILYLASSLNLPDAGFDKEIVYNIYGLLRGVFKKTSLQILSVGDVDRALWAFKYRDYRFFRVVPSGLHFQVFAR